MASDIRPALPLVQARGVDLRAALEQAIPGLTLSDSLADRVCYARDLWPRHHLEVRDGRPAEHLPRLIVWPTDTAQVAQLVGWAQEQGVPLVPFGAGSGVCGAVLPAADTVIVDLKRLRHWKLHEEQLLLEAQPGVMGITLEEELGRLGFTVGHFPSSILCSTVGGWIAARGAGQCSGRYGKIEDLLERLELVTPTGEVVELSRRARGPNLLPLIVGSEGTLGFITRAWLRVQRLPERRGYVAWSFPDIEAGWSAMRRIYQAGLRPPVARLYDPIDSVIMRSGSVKTAGPRRGPRARPAWLRPLVRGALKQPGWLNLAIRSFEGNLLGGCTLVLVFEGSAAEVEQDLAAAATLARLERGQELGEGPARRWWEHRYSISFRQAPVFQLGAFSDTLEVAAPWSKLSALYRGVRAALSPHVLVMAHLSHAYPDGCSIYFTFTGAAQDEARALALYDAAWRDATRAVLAAGGTISHHHGVGRSKAQALAAELGAAGPILRAVLRSFDPARICNPGNFEPAPGVAASASAPAVPPAAELGLDELSELATFGAETTLEEAEQWLGRRGFSLGLEGWSGLDGTQTLGAWLGQGCPGAPDPRADPVDTLVVGLVARLAAGRSFVVRPAPRRATGPELAAVFRGTQGRMGHVERLTLRVRRTGAPRVRALPFQGEQEPALSAAERRLLERLEQTLKEVPA